jgi:hypothetical protein
MSFRSALQVGPDHVARLSPTGLVDLMDRLLHAEAYGSGVDPTKVIVNTEISAADEGQDAWTPGAPQGSAWLGPIETCWQFKSGKEAGVAGEIRKHERVQQVLARGGRYVVVASALGNGETGADPRLATLRTEARDLGLPSDRIDLWSCDRLVAWCNEHPSIAAQLTQLPDGWQTLDECLGPGQHDEYRVPFVASGDTQRIIDEIRATIDPNRGTSSHVHLWGPPGVGKTRLALETCRDADWKLDTLYLRQASHGEVARVLGELARERQVRAVVVADEIPSDDLRDISDAVHRASGRIRLVSIGHDRPPGGLSLVSRELLPLDEHTMMDFVSKLHRGMPLDHQRYVAHVADGFVRLAILIAGEVARDPRVTTRGVLQHPDIRPILAKLFRPEERSALHVVAALEYVGWEDDVADEGKLIAEHLGLPWASVQGAIQTRAHDIVQKRGRYRYLSPRPLALHLAGELWDTYPNEMKSLPQRLPRDEARDSFYRRLGALASSGHASEFARRELSQFFRVEHFVDELAVRRWRAVSVAAPSQAVGTLRNVLANAAVDARVEIPAGARRELVEALTHASAFEATFEDAVLALAELAVAETEGWANNATGEFIARFSIFGSGSPVPFKQRVQVLDALVAKGKAYVPLVVRALENAPSADGIRMIRGASGAGPVEDEWRPAGKEHIEAAHLALSKLTALAALAMDELAPAILEAVKNTIWLVVVDSTQEQATNFVTAVATAYPALREDIEAVLTERIRLERQYHHYRAEAPALQRAEETLTRLQDSSPRGRLRRLVRLVDHERSPVPGMIDLARELAVDPTPLLAEWSHVTSGQVHGAWDLGVCLADADAACRLLDLMVGAPERGSDLRVISAYLDARSRREPEGWLDSWLDEYEKNHADDVRLLFDVTWRCASSDRGAARVIRLLSREPLPFSAETLSYGGWVSGLSQSAFASLVVALVSKPEHRAAAIALLEHRMGTHERDFAAVEEQAFALVVDPQLIRGHVMTAYYWRKLAERFIKTRPGALTEAIFRAHANKSERSWFIQHSEAAGVILACGQAAPGEVWGVLAPLLAARGGVRLSIGVPRGIIDLAPHEAIISWAREDPGYRVAVLAGIVSKVFDDGALAAKLLDVFGDDEGIRSTFAGQYWSGFWNGPASARERSLAVELDQIAARSGYANVRRWARETAETMRVAAQREEVREAEEELRWR